jgi:hypothetical protein
MEEKEGCEGGSWVRGDGYQAGRGAVAQGVEDVAEVGCCA